MFAVADGDMGTTFELTISSAGGVFCASALSQLSSLVDMDWQLVLSSAPSNEGDGLAISTTGTNEEGNIVVLNGVDNDIEVSYNGSNSVTIAVNGTLDRTITVTPSGTWTLDRFTIGSLFRNTNANFFTGMIKDVELRLNGVLTNAWPLNEGSGLIARDTVGGKHGRIHNFTNEF